MEWLSANWHYVLVAITITMSALNAATRHWSSHEGFVKVATFITELLSVLVSKDVQGMLKLPGVSKKE